MSGMRRVGLVTQIKTNLRADFSTSPLIYLQQIQLEFNNN